MIGNDNMNQKIGLFMLLILIPLTGINITETTAANGDSIATAINLPLNTIVNGTISSSSYDSVYYNVTITNPGLYSFNVTADPSTTNFDLFIFSSNDTMLGYSADSIYPETIIGTVPSGVYILEVQPFTGNGAFSISAANYAYHPGENLANAITLPFNTTVDSTIPYGYYFNVSIINSGYYKFNLSTINGFTFNLYDSQGSQLQSSVSPPDPSPYWQQEILANLSAGSYYLEVNDNYGTGPFNISVVPYAIHPGEVLATAVPLSLNSTVTGSLPYNYYYSVSITTAGYYRFNLTDNLTYSSDFDLYSSSMTYINSPSTYNTLYRLVIYLTPGSYYLEVYNYVETGAFNLSFSSYTLHPGEYVFNALPLHQNTTVTASMPYNSYFNFTIISAQYYEFTMTIPKGVDFSLTIYDTSGFYVGSSSNFKNFQVADVNLSSGNYSLEVSSYNGTGSFNLTYIPYVIPGIDLAHAINLPLNSTFAGIDPFNDYYNVSITKEGEYTFNFTATPNNSFWLDLYDADGGFLTSAYGTTYPLVLNTYLTSGNYSVEVTPFLGTGPFNLTFSPYNYAPGQNLAHAITLPIHTNFEGNLTFNYWFNVTITNQGDYQFTLSTYIYQSGDLILFSSTGTVIQSNQLSDFPLQYEYSLVPGNYSLEVLYYVIDTFNISYSSYTPPVNSGTAGSSSGGSVSNNSSNSTSVTSATTSQISKTTPFTPISIIVSSLMFLSMSAVFRKKKLKR